MPIVAWGYFGKLTGILQAFLSMLAVAAWAHFLSYLALPLVLSIQPPHLKWDGMVG